MIILKVKIKKKEFLNLNQNILNLKDIKNVWMEGNTKENAIFTFFVQLIMKCIFNKEKNQHYLYSMINDVI